MKTYKIGVIGLGSIAQSVHLPIIKNLKNVEISAICDTDKLRLKSVAKKFNAQNTYTDIVKFYEDNSFDAVFVLTPTDTHKEIVKISSLNCRNIFIEKPLTNNIKDAQDILDAADKQSINIFIGMNMRFRPDSMLLKTIIKNNELSNPYLLRIGYFVPNSSNRNYFQKRQNQNPVIIELGIPTIDLGMWLLGYPKVYSVSSKNHYFNDKKSPNALSAFIKTENNIILSLDLSRNLTYEKELFYCNLFTGNGYAFLNPLRISKNIKENNNELIQIKNLNEINQSFKSYENEIKYFLNIVSGLIKPTNPVEEILKRMKIIEAINKSDKLNKEIKIN